MLSLCSVICCVCYMDGFSISSTKAKIMIVSLCIKLTTNQTLWLQTALGILFKIFFFPSLGSFALKREELK